MGERHRLWQVRRFSRLAWHTRGTLYTHASVYALIRSVEHDLEEWGHRAPELVPLTTAPESIAIEHDDHEPESQQAAYLYPIDLRGSDRAWRCVECGDSFDLGLGCVQCAEPVCRSCVRAEAHVCAERRTTCAGRYDATLQRIADEIGPDQAKLASVHSWHRAAKWRRRKKRKGLTKSRVQQIEQNALANLRAPMTERGISCAS